MYVFLSIGIHLLSMQTITNIYANNHKSWFGKYFKFEKKKRIGKNGPYIYDLSVLNTPIFKFKMAFDLEFNWDIMYVEYSTDSGINWKSGL